jgi:hypothetical protein
VNDDPKKASVTNRDRPVGLSIAGRVIAYVDGLLAFTMMMAAYGLVVLAASYGFAALFKAGSMALAFFAPSALLFGLAQRGMLRRWKARWWIQAAAILWAIFSIAALIHVYFGNKPHASESITQPVPLDETEGH